MGTVISLFRLDWLTQSHHKNLQSTLLYAGRLRKFSQRAILSNPKEASNHSAKTWILLVRLAGRGALKQGRTDHHTTHMSKPLSLDHSSSLFCVRLQFKFQRCSQGRQGQYLLGQWLEVTISARSLPPSVPTLRLLQLQTRNPQLRSSG